MLITKLSNINKLQIKKLESGYALTIDELWDNVISDYLPNESVLYKWHITLLEYVKRNDTVFAIRGLNTDGKKNYDNLRRGFLSKSNEGYSFFLHE